MAYDDRDEPLPTGLLSALAQNMQAMSAFAALDAEARAQLIARAAETHSRAEMQALVNDLPRVERAHRL
ncbi:MAG: hypothetical protein J6R04_00770 [Clostridia bacterium]|nr:hypothetical protein [Clostridia bacterium]